MELIYFKLSQLPPPSKTFLYVLWMPIIIIVNTKISFINLKSIKKQKEQETKTENRQEPDQNERRWRRKTATAVLESAIPSFMFVRNGCRSSSGTLLNSNLINFYYVLS